MDRPNEKLLFARLRKEAVLCHVRISNCLLIASVRNTVAPPLSTASMSLSWKMSVADLFF